MLTKKRARKKQFSGTLVTSYAVLAFAVAFALFPVYWMVMTSFKEPADTRKPDTILPFIDFRPTLMTWDYVLFGFVGSGTWRALLNASVISGSSATICVLLGSLCGYGLARFRFRRWKNRDIASFILSQRMMPPAIVLVPIFVMFSTLRMVDTWAAIAMVHSAMNLPLVVWILRDFFMDVPREVEESAYIDGASQLQAFYKISLPLVLPGLVVSWIIAFIFSWNEFIVVLSLAYSQSITMPWLISTGFALRAVEYWTIATYGFIAIIPPIVLAVLIQKYLVRGLTFGAVKG